MENPRSLKQVQSEIAKVYKVLELDLLADNLEYASELRGMVNYVVNSEINWWDLQSLRNIALIYKNQLTNNVKLHTVADYLLLKLESVLNENKIGYTDIFNNYPNNNCVLESAKDALTKITNQVPYISSELASFSNIVKIFVSEICAEYDDELIKKMQLDLTYSRQNSVDFARNTINYLGSTTADFAADIYTSVSNPSAGQVDSLVGLADAINLYHTLNQPILYQDIASGMNDIMQGLTSSLYRQTAENIVNYVNANMDIADGLELLFINQYPLEYLNSQSSIAVVSGDNPYNIAASFYVEDFLNYPLVKAIGDLMANFHNNHPTSNIVSLIHNSLFELSGEYSTNDIASGILESLENNSKELQDRLTLSLNNLYFNNNLQVSEIADLLLNSFGSLSDETNLYTDPYLTAFALDNILASGINANIIDEAEYILATAIDDYKVNSNFPYASIVTKLTNRLLTQTNKELNDLYGLAEAVANSIGGGDNKILIDALTYDLLNNYISEDSDTHSQAMASKIYDSLDGLSSSVYDGTSIAAVFYSPLYELLKAKKGLANVAKLFMEDIEQSISKSKTHDSITSLFGNKYLHVFGNQEYFNKCSFIDDETYIVTESVLKFQSDEQTGKLEKFYGLNSITGQMAAMAQCATWVLSVKEADLIITKTNAVGTTGTSEETGCSNSLDPALAMGMCEELFNSSPQ